MTLLAPSLISPTTSKLLSYLSFSNHDYKVGQSSKSTDITTYITIVMKKDGTPTTKYLNPPAANHKLLSRRRRSSLSQYTSPPKQRKLISSFIPRFYNLSRKYSIGSSTSLNPSQSTSGTKPNPSKKINRIEQLPLELLLKIVIHLDCHSLLNLARTNPYFYQLCHQHHHFLWQTLIQHDYRIQTRLIDPYTLYKNHFELQKRWTYGRVKTRYLTGHDDSVYCLVWLGPDKIMSGSRDRSIKLWDLTNDSCLTKVHHEGSVLCLRVAENQSFFVSGSSDTTCLVWSLPDCVPLRRLVGHSSGVLDLCVVEDRWIVSSSRDATIRVWDYRDGREVRRLVGHTGPVNALGAFGGLVVSASGDTTLKLWDIQTGDCLRSFVGHTRGLACVRFDGKFIYSGGQDNKMKVWNAQTGQCLSTLTGHTDLIRTIDSYENLIVSGSYDRTLRVWDREENKCLLSFQSGHSSWIFNCLLNKTKIISAGQDKRIMVLDFGYELVTVDS